MASNIDIKTFSGGVSDDADNETFVAFDVLQHFSLNTSTNKLVPNRSLEADEDKTFDITTFLYANGVFYGFGKGTGGDAAKAQIYEKSSPITGTWGVSTGGTSTASGSFPTGGAIGHYKDHIYGVWLNTKVFDYGDITGTPTFTDTFATLSVNPSVISNSIIGKDDEFYFGHDNFLAQIATILGTPTFTQKKLTLPPEFSIRSLEVWGSYLAIFASGDGLTTNSKLFLWNYIDADPSIVVDLGREAVYVGANVDGALISVSLSDGSSLSFDQDLVVKVWSGGEVSSVLWSKPRGSAGWSILPEKFVSENSLFFCLNRNDDSSLDKGVWSVGRKNSNFPWRVNQDIKAINNTSTTASIQGFYLLGEYWWIAHSLDGSVDRTNNDSAYSATSILETEVFTGEDATKTKRLLGVAASFEPLANGGTVTVKYKVDEESSYTTIGSEATNNATIFEASASTTGQLPTEWRKIQFRIESDASAELTGFRAKIDVMGTPLD